MAKAKVTDLRASYPELAPDKDYPPLRFKSLEGKVSAAEWEARVDCACAYRLVKHFGMDDLIYNHISARIPGTEEFLLNPMGLTYDEICASSLIKVDLAGKVLWQPEFPEGLGYQFNLAGYVITELHDCHWESNGLLDMRRNPRVFHELFHIVNSDTVIVPKWERASYWAGETAALELSIAHGAGQPLEDCHLEISLCNEMTRLSLPRIAAPDVLHLGRVAPSGRAQVEGRPPALPPEAVDRREVRDRHHGDGGHRCEREPGALPQQRERRAREGGRCEQGEHGPGR